MPPRITSEQRRARLGVRHRLAMPVIGAPPDAVADDLLALHATDPASVYLSVAARATDLHPDDLSRALYDDRTLIRMLGMRRTMFVVPTAAAPVVQHSSSDAVASPVAAGAGQGTGVGACRDPEPWLTDLEDAVVGRLRDLGRRHRRSRCPGRSRGCGPRSSTRRARPTAARWLSTARVLNMISAQGRIVRGRSAGGWTGGQYEWAPIEKWLPGRTSRRRRRRGQGELVRPLAGQVRSGDPGRHRLVDRLEPRRDPPRVGLDRHRGGGPGRCGRTGARGRPAAGAEPPPWIALLPALDPTPMGWAGRDWYIEPEHRKVLFDRTGNIGPSVWCNGRVVGGWAQRADGVVVWRMFTDIGAEQSAAVEAEAARLTGWIGGVKVVPKFRTPLERELTA